MEKFESQEYRDELAREIKQEPDRQKRREILKKAKTTPEYQEAKKVVRGKPSEEKKEEAVLTSDKSRLFEEDLFNIIPGLNRQEKERFVLLAERNLRRFETLGLAPDDLEILVADLGNNYAKAEPFLEKCLISPKVLYLPEELQDFVVSHEIAHVVLNQELARRFYKKYPELRKKREKIIRALLDGEHIRHVFPENDMENFLKNRMRAEIQQFSHMINIEEALLALSIIVKNAEEEREICTDINTFKRAEECGISSSSFFMRFLKQPISQEEYERLVVVGILQAGSFLTEHITKNQLIEESGSDIKDVHDMEEGVANYLASVLVGISPSDAARSLGFSSEKYKGETAYVLDMREKYLDDAEEVFQRIKKGESVYKILERRNK